MEQKRVKEITPDLVGWEFYRDAFKCWTRIDAVVGRDFMYESDIMPMDRRPVERNAGKWLVRKP